MSVHQFMTVAQHEEIHMKDADRLREVNAELRRVIEAAYQYLNNPHHSGYGNVEIIDMLCAALKGGQS